jgi:hypothetical protein
MDLKRFATLCSGAALLFSTPAVAQQTQAPSKPPPNLPNAVQYPGIGSPPVGSFFSKLTPYEFWLTCLIAGLGLATIGILVFALLRMPQTRPEDISRPLIVITVVFAALILVTAGYSNEQIAPAFGLFGTIVGYILGRLSQTPQSSGTDIRASGTLPDAPQAGAPPAPADQQPRQ